MTDIDLVEKYGKFCGFMAWQFVSRGQTAAKRENQLTSLHTEDAEDLASIAMIGLLKCPAAHRHEPPYVKRLIINHIIKGWHKMNRWKGAEQQAPTGGDEGSIERTAAPSRSFDYTWGSGRDFFDNLPGRDGLAGYTALKYDSAAVLAILPLLPESERLVIELSFGLLPGTEAIGLDRIARKLGRTKYWADIRLQKGLVRVREHLQLSAN